MSKEVPSNSVPVILPVDVIAPDPIVPAKVAFCELSIANATVPLALLVCVASSNVGVPSVPSLAPLKDIP